MEARFQKPNQFQRKSSTFPGIARKSTYQFTDFNIKRYFVTGILTEAPTGRKNHKAGSNLNCQEKPGTLSSKTKALDTVPHQEQEG